MVVWSYYWSSAQDAPPALWVREKITSQNWRSDLVQVWLIGESKTTGITSYFDAFESEVSAKDGLKLRCKNVKLFLREPYAKFAQLTGHINHYLFIEALQVTSIYLRKVVFC